MKSFLKMAIVALLAAGYIFALIHVAPVHESVFIFNIALIGLVAWFYGVAAGAVCTMATLVAARLIFKHIDVSYASIALLKSPDYLLVGLLAAAALGRLRTRCMRMEKSAETLSDANRHLKSVLAEVKELGGVIALCTSCKKIKDDSGEWKNADAYLKEKTKADFSHGICPQCAKTLYGEHLGEDYDYHAPPPLPPDGGK